MRAGSLASPPPPQETRAKELMKEADIWRVRQATMLKQAIRKKSTPGKKPIKTKGAKKSFLAELAVAHGRRLLWLALEVIALGVIALVGVIAALGRATERFAGVALWSSLVPFAGVVLMLAVLVFLGFRLWVKIRSPAQATAAYLPALMAVSLAVGVGWLASGDGFRKNLGQLRSLVGGVRQAETTTLSHQVYAAYRRTNLAQMRVLLERAKPYEADIQEAASIFKVDVEVMMGLGRRNPLSFPATAKTAGAAYSKSPPRPRPPWKRSANVWAGSRSIGVTPAITP